MVIYKNTSNVAVIFPSLFISKHTKPGEMFNGLGQVFSIVDIIDKEMHLFLTLAYIPN
jgi:hypothetical protein